jgi:prepilin-type N-terminal cleavage/methylation domain-containing protein
VRVKNQNGFTLIEALVVVCMMGVLLAVAMPYFGEQRKDAQFKDGARLLASAFREARSIAISRNLETRVWVDVPGKSFHIEVGDLPNNAANWTALKGDEPTLAPAVRLKSANDCSGTTAISILFSPNGTGQTGVLCVMDGTTPKYRVGVQSAASGRVEIKKGPDPFSLP